MALQRSGASRNFDAKDDGCVVLVTESKRIWTPHDPSGGFCDKRLTGRLWAIADVEFDVSPARPASRSSWLHFESEAPETVARSTRH